MDVQTLDDAKLKDLMKKALVEILYERKDFFIEILTEAMEDIGMVRAIQEGESTPLIAREKIFNYLENES